MTRFQPHLSSYSDDEHSNDEHLALKGTDFTRLRKVLRVRRFEPNTASQVTWSVYFPILSSTFRQYIVQFSPLSCFGFWYWSAGLSQSNTM